MLNGLAKRNGVHDAADLQRFWRARGIQLPINMLRRQMKMGIEVEYEHTFDRADSKRITLDHLVEIPDYYDRLRFMERQAEEEWGGIR